MAARDRARLIGFALLALLLSSAAPATPVGSKEPKVLAQAYVWYDGDQARTVWLDPHLVADFTRRPSHQGAMRRTYPRAQALRRPHAGMRLWRADERVGAMQTLRALKDTAPDAPFSPVLRDGPSEDAPLRALPGNVIVYFSPGWDEATVTAWVQARGLEIVQRLPVGQNAYVLKTAPGLESLQTANALYGSGEVVAAFPDWWREIVPR